MEVFYVVRFEVLLSGGEQCNKPRFTSPHAVPLHKLGDITGRKLVFISFIKYKLFVHRQVALDMPNVTAENVQL